MSKGSNYIADDPIFDIATEVLNTEESESEVVEITPEPVKKVKKSYKKKKLKTIRI